jgi:hypothetical protein
MAGRKPLQQGLRQGNNLEKKEGDSGKNQHGRPEGSAGGFRAEELADGPGRGRQHGQRREDQLPESVPAPHDQRHYKDDSRQAEIDDLQQQGVSAADKGLSANMKFSHLSMCLTRRFSEQFEKKLNPGEMFFSNIIIIFHNGIYCEKVAVEKGEFAGKSRFIRTEAPMPPGQS